MIHRAYIIEDRQALAACQSEFLVTKRTEGVVKEHDVFFQRRSARVALINKYV